MRRPRCAIKSGEILYTGARLSIFYSVSLSSGKTSVALGETEKYYARSTKTRQNSEQLKDKERIYNYKR